MKISEISKELDKIVVSEKEMRQINKWLLSLDGNMGMLGKNKFFPLNNFVLDMELYKGIHYVFLVELDNFNPCKGRFSNEGWDITYHYEEQNHRWRFDGNVDSRYVDSGEGGQGLTKRMHSIIYGTLLYICEYAKKRTEKVSPQVTKKERENYEYKPRECYLLNDIVKYVSIHPNKSSIKYRCEVWGVRGHIRHYKDGKIVFIKPYKKGRKRDVLEPKSKTYLLEGGVTE